MTKIKCDNCWHNKDRYCRKKNIHLQVNVKACEEYCNRVWACNTCKYLSFNNSFYCDITGKQIIEFILNCSNKAE